MGCSASSAARVGQAGGAAGPPRGVKLLVAGSAGAGKTAVCRRYLCDAFEAPAPGSPRGAEGEEARRPALGLKHMVTRAGELTVEVWDVPASAVEQHSEALYTEGADGVVVVCDTTNPRSFQDVAAWRKALADAGRDVEVPLVLLANKSDHPACVMGEDEVQESADALGASAGFHASARDGKRVAEAFATLLRLVERQRGGGGEPGKGQAAGGETAGESAAGEC